MVTELIGAHCLDGLRKDESIFKKLDLGSEQKYLTMVLSKMGIENASRVNVL